MWEKQVWGGTTPLKAEMENPKKAFPFQAEILTLLEDTRGSCWLACCLFCRNLALDKLDAGEDVGSAGAQQEEQL